MACTGYVYMQPNNLFVIGLTAQSDWKRLHVNTLIDRIELDWNEISIGLKGEVYSFSTTIERACKHSIRLKTETERTAHVQWCRNSVMTYDAWNKRFFLLNKVLYKCVSCHYITLLSLSSELVPPVLDSRPQATRSVRREGHFCCVINISSTAQRFMDKY